MGDTNPDTPLVVVFHAGDPVLLPLAESALQQEGIDYQIRRTDTLVPVGFGHQAEFGGMEGAADVPVNTADADRARSILADLELALDAPNGALPSGPPLASAPAPAGPRTHRLIDPGSGATICEITAAQLKCLVDALEEESDTDRDYYIDAATIDVLADAGADAELLGMLRTALGDREGTEIAWQKR